MVMKVVSIFVTDFAPKILWQYQNPTRERAFLWKEFDLHKRLQSLAGVVGLHGIFDVWP